MEENRRRTYGMECGEDEDAIYLELCYTFTVGTTPCLPG